MKMIEKRLEQQAEEAADFIIKSERIVVFTGAGVSTESGIPDFRSPGGVWSKYDPDDLTYQRFVKDPVSRKNAWRVFQEAGITKEADPNPAHYGLADLHKLGKLDCVITQNVDNLHQKAGLPDENVFELHGNMQWVVCLTCNRRYPFPEIKARLDREGEPPNCEVCDGILKPDGVFFGEQLPEKVLKQAIFHSNACELFIVIGSSLVVTPAAYMPNYAVQAGARLVIINLTPTHIDKDADLVIRAKAGEAMSLIVKSVKRKIG